MKIIIVVVSLFATALCIGQSRIPTQEEASAFFEKEDKTGFIFHSITEDDELFELYAKKQPGDVIVSGTRIYKVLNVKNVHIVNYSLLQLEQTLTPEQVLELEKTIIAKYNSGIPFVKLIEEYREYKYASNSEAEWPLENFDQHRREMFEKHKVGEIFTINDPANNSYKILIKNNNPFPEKVISIWEAEYK